MIRNRMFWYPSGAVPSPTDDVGGDVVALGTERREVVDRFLAETWTIGSVVNFESLGGIAEAAPMSVALKGKLSLGPPLRGGDVFVIGHARAATSNAGSRIGR